MTRKIIHSDDAPKAIGPYNQAVKVGNTLYMSGQIALDSTSGKLVGDEIKSETHQVMKNLRAVLKAADMDFGNVVKSTLYITYMDHYADINEVYGSYFDAENAPARETVQVSRLPKDVNIEISMIAVK